MDIFDAVYFSEVVVVFVMVFNLALLGKNGSGQCWRATCQGLA